MKYLILALLLVSQLTNAEIQTTELSYEADGSRLSGFVAWDDALEGPRPGVLVVHEWWGHNDYARQRAKALAALGYVGFALDMYGDGKLAAHPDDAGKFMKEVSSRFDGMKARFLAARTELTRLDQVDKTRIGAIGYCFGGGVVLNMARANEDLAGVVSFHGSLGPTVKAAEKITVPVLALNGADDPFVSAEAIQGFESEMEAAQADYRFVNYPGAKHSFTNPGATEVGKKFGMPLEYNADADKQSWEAMREFFAAVFK